MANALSVVSATATVDSATMNNGARIEMLEHSGILSSRVKSADYSSERQEARYKVCHLFPAARPLVLRNLRALVQRE